MQWERHIDWMALNGSSTIIPTRASRLLLCVFDYRRHQSASGVRGTGICVAEGVRVYGLRTKLSGRVLHRTRVPALAEDGQRLRLGEPPQTQRLCVRECVL